MKVETMGLKNRIVGYHGKRIKVLIVDDLITNREVLKELILPLGFEVQEAVDGYDALAKIHRFNPRNYSSQNGVPAVRL